MERDRSSLTLCTTQPLVAGVPVSLDDEAAHHARVRRVREGERVRLVDGVGHVATGVIASAGKRMTVDITDLATVPRPVPLDVVVPVADRDRMLFAAEKCVELQATAWRPAWFARSRSVSPRGEGEKFREKVLARMRSALEQSRGAWLPEVFPEIEVDTLTQTIPEGHARLLLDQGGEPLAGIAPRGPCAIAAGPEGGYDSSERDMLIEQGWRAVSLGNSVLRFETAVMAAAAVIRAAQHTLETT